MRQDQRPSAPTTALLRPELAHRDLGWHASHPLPRPNAIPSLASLDGFTPSLTRVATHW